MGWHDVPPIGAGLDDYPDMAGQKYIATVENRYGQISTTTLATGYGDFKWYACESQYQTEPGKDSTLNSAWRVIAWQEMPTARNPYKIDVRYHIKWLREHLDRGDNNIDIHMAIANLTDGFEYNTGIPLIEHDSHAASFWNEKAQEERETKEAKEDD